MNELPDGELLCEECFGRGLVYCEHLMGPTCGYCRDCRWWRVDTYLADKDWRACDNPAVDELDYSRADFGCIQWEAKDDTR